MASAISAVRASLCGLAALLLLASTAALPAAAQTVAAYHGGPERSGNFTIPGLTWRTARSLKLDPNFMPGFQGNLYAQPLFWHPSGQSSGKLIVATESNVVAAIDAVNGSTVWSRTLGAPVPLSSFRCGNIDPLGITGTPVIDEASGTLYLDAMIADTAGPRHKLFALSLQDGSVLPGWPIDVQAALQAAGQSFDSRVQNQRGALTIVNDTLYVPYGGFFGDCGDYKGWVVGVKLSNIQQRFGWRAKARGGGIWAPGGIASDGQSLFVATGNTMGASQWSDGEAVIRLPFDLARSDKAKDYFAPGNWQNLDNRDADLGGTNPLPLNLPQTRGTQPVVLALGKDQKAYLLDRNNLGGIGGALLVETVATFPIRTSPAAYPVGDSMYVAFEGSGANCPTRQGRGGVVVLRLKSGTPPKMDTAWCGGFSGAGAAMVTTADGSANPIVWLLGAEGDNRLHGYRGDTGEKLFTSSPLTGLRHFQTLIAAADHLYVGADGRLYAFGAGP